MRKEDPEPGTKETQDQESVWLAHPFHPLLEKITEMELKEESLDDNRKYSKYYSYELMIKVISFILDEAQQLRRSNSCCRNFFDVTSCQALVAAALLR